MESQIHHGLSSWCGQWNVPAAEVTIRRGWGCQIQRCEDLTLQGPTAGIAFKPCVPPQYHQHEKKPTRKHCGKGDRSFSNPVHSALWLLRYTAADCYSSQSWGHEWGFCLESVQRRAEAGSYRASRGNHRGKTCLKGEIKNSLGRECVYMWHDMYLLSWSAELLPKQSWKLSENGGFF